MRIAVRRTLVALLTILIMASAAFLYYGGRYLQHDDALIKADAIFVLAGTRAERLLEGYELYTAGYAPIVMLSPGRPEPGERLLRARGIRFPLDSEIQRAALIQLGVPAAAIVAPGGSMDNTAQEADLLRAAIAAHGWRRVIVVTSKYHTRRAGFAFRRGTAGTGAAIVMRSSRYDSSDPANWWRIRADFRFALSEWEKLAAYRLGLGG
jgi:uncharacterized SAM-binding protein YcdF (DUF218 family)